MNPHPDAFLGGIGKFAYRFDQWLYMQEPDDYFGDSVDGDGWYGLYGKRILVEQSNGFVSVTKFDTRQEAHDVFYRVAAGYYEEENQL